MSRYTSTEKATKKAELYRKAAKLIEAGAVHSKHPERDAGPANYVNVVGFSCCAVAEAQGIFPSWNYHEKSSRLVERYRDIFDGDFGGKYDPESKDHRIVALCMMAAMVEAGDA
jgi:hypothetical protein